MTWRSILHLLCGCLLSTTPLILAQWAFTDIDRFPANDDFLYARTVSNWLQEGRYDAVTLNGLPAVSSFAHAALAAAVAAIAGFSYRTLHAVVLLQGILAGSVLYLFSRRAGCSAALASLVVWCFCGNAFVLGHSFTFMTDAPAVFWMTIALAAYGTSPFSFWTQLAGGVAALIAVWCRQTSIAVILLPVLLLLRPIRGAAPAERRSSLKLLAASVLPPVLAFLAYECGLFNTGNVFREQPGIVQRYDLAWIKNSVDDIYVAGLLVGTWALPLTPFLWAQFRSGQRPPGCLGILVLSAWLARFCWSGWQAYLTAAGDFLQNAHLGPIILADAYLPDRWQDMGGVSWPPIIWQALTVAAIAAFALVVELASKAVRLADVERGLVVTMTGIVLSLVFMLDYRFDRYWMTLIAPLFVFLACQLGQLKRSTPKSPWLLAAPLMVGSFWISLAFTHDYLAWNQARWRLVEAILAQTGIDAVDADASVPPLEVRPEKPATAPCEVDGGYEVNGWFRSAEDRATRPRAGDATRWWSHRARFAIAIGPMEGFAPIGESRWFSWATFRTRGVLLLERRVQVEEQSPGERGP